VVLCANWWVSFRFFDEICCFSFDSCFVFSDSGQPRVTTGDVGHKAVVWTAIMANGQVWPPVIFVKEQPRDADLADGCYSDGNAEHFAYVHWTPASAAPSFAQLEIWLESMNNPTFDVLEGTNHVICDSASFFTGKEAAAAFAQHNIVARIVSAAAGKYANPCDQAPHREMRRQFNRLQQHSPGNKISNIISAYYSLTEELIVNSFESLCYFAGNVSGTITANAREGYAPTKARRRDFEMYEEAFAAWQKHNAALSERATRIADPMPVVQAKRRRKSEAHGVVTRSRAHAALRK
jgi:hypothetical protein